MLIRQRSGGTRGLGARLFLSVFFAIFAAVGGWIFVLTLASAERTLETYYWMATPCTIEASDFKPGDAAGWQLRYRYISSGRDYLSTVISRNHASRDTSDDLRLSQKFTAGQTGLCYVNPQDPADSVFLREDGSSAFVVLFPLPFVAIGLGGFYFVWRPRRRPAEGAGDSLTERVATTTPHRRGLQVGFFGLFFVVGLFATWALGVRPLLRIMAARSWVAAPCTIVSSEVLEHDGDNGSTYRVGLLFRYTYEGRAYMADRYTFSRSSSSGRAGKRQIVAAFPPGSTTTCYVNPADPTDAVIERGFTGELWFGLIPLVFVLVGGAGMVGAFGPRRRAGNPGGMPRDRHRSMHEPGENAGTAGSTAEGGGPVVLEIQRSRAGRFLAILVFALIWNGIVGAIFFSTWGGGGFVTWFLIPFLAIGVGALAMTVHAGLAILNPRPRLTVSSNALPPGGILDLQWQVTGSTQRLRRLQVLLEGREEATYRRGTDTHTDKSVFATIAIADVRDPAEIAAGAARVSVPAGAMHTFTSQHNRIAWRLRVQGEIPRWPDMDDEFPFTVLALAPVRAVPAPSP